MARFEILNHGHDAKDRPAVLDIIAIHHTEHHRHESRTDKEKSCFSVQDLLPFDCPRARIHSWVYYLDHSKITKSDFKSLAQAFCQQLIISLDVSILNWFHDPTNMP